MHECCTPTVEVAKATWLGRCVRTNPTRLLKRRQPWFDAACAAAKQRVEHARRSRASPAVQANAKKKYRAVLDKAKKDFMINLPKLCLTHPRHFWKLLKVADDPPQVTLPQLVEYFAQMFAAQHPNEKHQSGAVGCAAASCELDELLAAAPRFSVSAADVKVALARMQSGKSCGNNSYPIEYCKGHRDTRFLQALALVCDHLINRHVPRELNAMLLMPLFKRKGSPKEVDNYRGISLTTRLASCLPMWYWCDLKV